MNKIFYLCLFVISSLGVRAQSEYIAYRLSRDIQYKSQGGNWCSLKLHQKIDFRDSLCIPQGGVAEFKELPSGHLLPSNTFGYMTLDDIIRAVRFSNQSLTKRATTAVINEINTSNTKNDYSSYGGTLRTLSANSTVEDSVFGMINQVVWRVMNQTTLDDSLCVAIPSIVDGGISYTFINSSEEFLCVNILKIDTVHHMVHFLYDKSCLADDTPYILVSPKSELTLDAVRFSPMPDCVLVSFATPFVYSTSMVATKLKHQKLNDSNVVRPQIQINGCYVNIIQQ